MIFLLIVFQYTGGISVAEGVLGSVLHYLLVTIIEHVYVLCKKCIGKIEKMHLAEY